MNYTKEAFISRVRGAIKDRARVQACMYESFLSAMPAEEAEKLARQAILRYGTIRGERDGHRLTADEWADGHAESFSMIYESKVEKHDDRNEIHMHHCPLLEEWKALGATPEQQDLYCDIAMELDRQRAAHHGIPCDIVERMGKGDSFCRIVLWKKPKP